ncbi:MAG: winged helix-turn-helix transcriptional regulator [Actinobacteria bacterium]|nr:winged helix-turn-helix transcriptional regulator [Actinomycetota bacterium]
MSPARRPAQRDYEELLRFRTALRRFLRWSEEQARAADLTPAQHQLLLAIKGHPGDTAPTVGEIADYLVTKHHSVVELIDRAVDAGVVERHRDAEDGRVVHLLLTPLGEERIETLSALALEELRDLPQFLPRFGDPG